MARVKKKRREDKLRVKREQERKRYQKIKSDPVAYEKQKEKERLKYLKKKEKGQIKPATQMIKKDLIAKRKKQKINSKNYRNRLAKFKKTSEYLSQNSPPESCDEIEVEILLNTPKSCSPIPTCSELQNKTLNDLEKLTEGTTNDLDELVEVTCTNLDKLVDGTSKDLNKSKKSSGRKKVRRDRTKMYKELMKYKIALKKAKSEAEKYKKRYYRLIKKISLNQNHSTSKQSPRTKVKNLLQNETVSPKIKKRLLFAEVVERQLADNYLKQKSDKSKQIFSKVVGGKILKKYKMLQASKNFLQYKRFIANNKRGCELIYHRKKRFDSIPREVKMNVIHFLEEDINSRLCPGKKDCITQKKVTKQKRQQR